MIYLIGGARPNFLKIAPLVWELKRIGFSNYEVIHTGQHYDYEMSQTFFDDLNLDPPDYFLKVGSGTHSYQTAEIMKAFESICLDKRPQMIIVVGDVNSTMACAIVGAKLNIPVAHVEAGLRSFDRTMPEEINRIVTDHISAFHFVTEESGVTNLKDEGLSSKNVHLVGNIMIDSLVKMLPRSKSLDALNHEYVLATIHRPSNVDKEVDLLETIGILREIARKLPVLLFTHPRTKKKIEEFKTEHNFIYKDFLQKGSLKKEIYLLRPVGYVEFLKYLINSKFVVTDSGGIQEETTYLNIPCITLRENTERPVTVDLGTNTVTGRNLDKVNIVVNEILENRYKLGEIPQLWDGKTGGRIVDIIQKSFY